MLRVLFEVPVEGSGSLTVAVLFLSCPYCVLRRRWLGSACTRRRVQFLRSCWTAPSYRVAATLFRRSLASCWTFLSMCSVGRCDSRFSLLRS
jgi:hypothetical protein